jgi:hypothetical protein
MLTLLQMVLAILAMLLLVPLMQSVLELSAGCELPGLALAKRRETCVKLADNHRQQSAVSSGALPQRTTRLLAIAMACACQAYQARGEGPAKSKRQSTPPTPPVHLQHPKPTHLPPGRFIVLSIFIYYGNLFTNKIYKLATALAKGHSKKKSNGPLGVRLLMDTPDPVHGFTRRASLRSNVQFFFYVPRPTSKFLDTPAII